jgi:hypothetical protein
MEMLPSESVWTRGEGRHRACGSGRAGSNRYRQVDQFPRAFRLSDTRCISLNDSSCRIFDVDGPSLGSDLQIGIDALSFARAQIEWSKPQLLKCYGADV